VRGFACHPCYHGRGALLPHLFTLTLRLGLSARTRAEGLAQSGIFSVPLIRQVALPGRYPAHCPVEFGLSSQSSTSRLRGVPGSGGRLADCDRSLSHFLDERLERCGLVAHRRMSRGGVHMRECRLFLSDAQIALGGIEGRLRAEMFG
jgi:hypothetical protein